VPAIVAASRLPATLVALTVFGQKAILVRKDSSIRSVQELKGKRIAFLGEGAQQYPMLVKALSDAGLKTRREVLGAQYVDKAMANVDPFSGASVLSRGIVGSKGDVVTVASPIYKQRFDLHTGVCLDDPSVTVRVHDTRVVDGWIEVCALAPPVEDKA